MTEVWFRNPHNYVRELAELGGPFNIVWDRGMLVKKRIDPVQHAKLYFGAEGDFRILCIGPQGTVHLDATHDWTNPVGVYPTWEHGTDDWAILDEMVTEPIGEDPLACSSDVPSDERPVFGQEHYVVVINPPSAIHGSSRAFYRNLAELQEENPDCKILIHGLYSSRLMFSMGYAAADIDPRTGAANGKIVLPNGRECAYARAVGHIQWVNMLGFSIVQLKEPRQRCLFNIKSARWMGEHWDENIKFKTRGSHEVDPDSPTTVIPTTAASRTKMSLAVESGDKIACNNCSLASNCKYFRDGAVCSVPGSETNALAAAFKSRSSDRIISGLGTVLAAQADRLERGMEIEDASEELSPEVTKIMNQLFTNGVKLAKLIDPSLTKPMVQINNGAASQVAASNPKEFMAGVVRAFEEQGISRDSITPEMLEGMMRKMAPNAPSEPPAIQGQVVGQ